VTHTRTHTYAHTHTHMEPHAGLYGDITVEMKSEKDKKDWTIQEFKLSMVSWNELMHACHFISK